LLTHLTTHITTISYKYIRVIRKSLTMAKKSVKLYTDNVLEAFYSAIVNNTLDRLHIPHSDVFYVRTALDAKFFPRTFTLKETEDYMKLEGWSERND
jgi:hypothetical protein